MAKYCHTSLDDCKGLSFSVTAKHEVTKQSHSIMLEVLIGNLQILNMLLQCGWIEYVIATIYFHYTTVL